MILFRHCEVAAATEAICQKIKTDCFVAPLLAMTAIGLLAGSLTYSPAWAKSRPKVKESLKDSPQELIRQAEDAWKIRDKPWQTESAVALWEQALRQVPERGELYIRLAKAAGRLYRHADTPKEREYWADEGRRYGEQAVAKYPDSPEALAAYGEMLGQWAQAHKGIGSLKVIKQAVKHLQKAVTLDPRYAFAHMLLAQFYEKSPGWFSVGDKKKALEHARLAVEYGGTYAINRVTLAKIYLARGDKAAAKEQLEKTIALTPPKDAVPETRSDQDDARELLKGL